MRAEVLEVQSTPFLSEVCGPAVEQGDLPLLDITSSEVEAEQNGDRLIHLSFITGMVPACKPKKLHLHMDDFQPAKTEIHVLEKSKRGAIITE